VCGVLFCSVHTYNNNKQTNKNENNTMQQLPYDEFIPNLFRLPVPGVKSKDVIHLVCEYMEPLEFHHGYYHFNMPMKFGSVLIPPEKKMGDILKITCIINSVNPHTTVQLL